MAIKYVPYFKDTISGQAILDNFTRTKRILKYADNNKVNERIERGLPLYETEVTEIVGNESDNLVIRGECLSACAYLKENDIKVDLVYIDPPFASGADYAKKIYIRRNPKVSEAIKKAEETLDDDELKSFEEKMYGDVWNKEAYLNWMYENLIAIKSVMSDNATIFVHLDYHIIHYVKILMDEVFGEDNFINEIIWRRKQSVSWAAKQFGITNDTILWYANNGDEYIFNSEYTLDDDNTQKYIKERFVYDDNDGRGKYMKSPLVNSLYRPNLKYEFHGIKPPANGWLYKREHLDEWYEKGELCIPDDPNMRISRKIFLSDYQGQPVQNIWLDIPIANPMSKERETSNYSTQKPEALLSRIIKTASNENMVVADFFGGSGVAAKVANDLGRKFIHCDIGINSIETTRDRLLSAGASFKIIDIKDGVNLYRNPVQTMEKLDKLIPGLVNEDSVDEFWEGVINDSTLGKIPVYVPNLMDSSTKILDVVLINKIVNQEITKLDDSIKKVIIYYIDIIDRKEIDNFIKDNLRIDIEIELRDLKEILNETVVNDVIEYHIESNKLFVDTFISDRLIRKIDEYNEKMNSQALSTGKKPALIEISNEGLELIELISLDCTSKDGIWHSDQEIKIDKLGYVIVNGAKKDYLWDGTISFNKKPLRIKVRNISGDESITIVGENE